MQIQFSASCNLLGPPTYPHLIHPGSINPKQLFIRTNALLNHTGTFPPPHSLPYFQSSKQNPISFCVTSAPLTAIPPILRVSSWSGHPHEKMKTSTCTLEHAVTVTSFSDSPFILLDLTAAVDTINHIVFPFHLQLTLHVTVKALSWIRPRCWQKVVHHHKQQHLSHHSPISWWPSGVRAWSPSLYSLHSVPLVCCQGLCQCRIGSNVPFIQHLLHLAQLPDRNKIKRHP